ncbi:MAG: peptidase M17 [Parachlamydia sp.]|nr:peptidase M17 [Parachlamydia sp.]
MLPLSFVDASSVLPQVGTVESIGKKGVEVELKVQSPSGQETPLQIICLFEYTEGDIFNSPPALPKELNGLVHVDQALGGLITEIRKKDQFEGKALETLLIKPPANSIPAKKLLLIGLGNREDFKPESMRMVGVVGMREALRLGVISYSHASDLKDAGYSSPTGDVAGEVIQGALEAYQTQKDLETKGVADPVSVTKITLLSGPTYFEDSKEGIKKVME